MNLQVYTAQCVEYSGGFFIGNKNDEPTKTLLSFFIASLFGGYEDLICFIPVTNLTSDKLLLSLMACVQITVSSKSYLVAA